MTAAGTATLLLAGSALFAMPADAAPINSHTVYASQLLDSSQSLSTQSLTVAGDVGKARVELVDFHARVDAAKAGHPASGSGQPGSAPASITVGGTTNADWAALVLTDAGLPVTQNNVTVILQWMDSENSPQHWWLRNNPLNNGLGSGGGGGFGRYVNLRTAALYVAKQLDRSLFAGIAASLAADSAPAVTEQAIIASPWASSHYGYGSRFHSVDVPIVAAPASLW